MSLFDNCPDNSGQIFKNVFHADTEMMVSAKKLSLELWEIYEPFADEHFISEIRRDFSARFWEMDLTCFFLRQQRNLICPKPGPDIKIDENIWVEAVSPTQGAADNLNRVPDTVMGEVHQVNGELIELRYTAAIIEKFNKYTSYIEKGIVQDDEPYIIALNSSQIPHAELDDRIPRIAKSLLAIGKEYVTFDRETHAYLGSGHQHQQSISKPSGSEVATDIFLDPSYAGISAVLYSNSDPVSRSGKDGQGYLLVHNPLAANPVEEGFLRAGKEIIPKISSETDYSVRMVSYD